MAGDGSWMIFSGDRVRRFVFCFNCGGRGERREGFRRGLGLEGGGGGVQVGVDPDMSNFFFFWAEKTRRGMGVSSRI